MGCLRILRKGIKQNLIWFEVKYNIRDGKMENDKELKVKESLWVYDVLKACWEGKLFDYEKNPAPSDAAKERVIKIIDGILNK